MSETKDKKELRRLLKKQRQTLSATQQRQASLALARNARKLHQLLSCQKVLSYAPIQGEIDPNTLLNTLNRATIYLPKITHYRNRRMRFYPNNHSLKKNVLGINEPTTILSSIMPQNLDAVLMPLLGFDRVGNRLGMGAGFYDRAFAFKGFTSQHKRPLLIGLAHHFQECASLDADSWDIPLDAIITDREIILI